MLVDWIIDAIIDTLKLAPFLLLTLFLMEYIEHRAADRLVASLKRAGRFGPAAGAALGCIPQCGFSVAAAHLYNGGLVTAGTLVAVFISTSDEAIPILLASPGGAPVIGKLIMAKLVIALIAGFALDALWKRGRSVGVDGGAKPFSAHCAKGDSWGHITVAAVKRTLSILGFLFAATLALNITLGLAGPERLSAILLSHSPLQPLLAALFGLIPNCAGSVLITELYLTGAISFGSAVAGLSTSAGLGLLALFGGKGNARARLIPLSVIYIAGGLSGLLLHILAIV